MKKSESFFRNVLNGTLAVGFAFHAVYTLNNSFGSGPKESKLEENVSVEGTFTGNLDNLYDFKILNYDFSRFDRPLCYREDIILNNFFIYL
jgi:hypothetical protein